MLQDVLALAELEETSKRTSKETLNHPGLLHLASGLDPLQDTPEAYRRAYLNLGIDIINRVPDRNADPPLASGEVIKVNTDYRAAALGLYDTVFRQRYPFETVEEFWQGDIRPDYEQLIVPVPHLLDPADIQMRMKLIQDVGLYYCMIYTTIFMWAVEYLGWEIFLTAAALDPEGFDQKFFQKVFPLSEALLGVLTEVDCPFVFCHDDLADARGPVFPPEWYDVYIFPRYRDLWKPIKAKGKKIIFVADGNMEALLDPLKATGVDGVMLENPATDFECILDHFSDRIIIGGIETGLLTRGTPAQIKAHVLAVHEKTAHLPGFVLSTPGGLHGGIPLENLEAYFDTRVHTGHTPANWRQH